jgi:hypothetical protein
MRPVRDRDPEPLHLLTARVYPGLLLGLVPALLIYMVNRKTITVACTIALFRYRS